MLLTIDVQCFNCAVLVEINVSKTMAGMSRVFSSGEQDPSDLNADRISNLPWNVLDIILGKLSITEAVRTSVLAKDWRYSWLTMSKFSLSSEEIGEVLDFRDPRWDILSSIVSNFLLHHTTTSIMTFILQSFFCSHFSDLSNWIEFLSKKGVEVLELIEFGDQYLKMPTHLFSFEKLKVLVIESFSLQIPSSFRSFKFLEELSLNEVSISSGDLYRLILACPLLLNLTLVTISGIQNLRIHSARLTMLEVDTGFVGIDVEFAPCLSTVSIINDYRSFTPQSVILNWRSVTRSLSGLISLQSLALSEIIFKLLVAECALKDFPLRNNTLAFLILREVSFDKIEVFRVCLSLLKFCPKMKTFRITVTSAKGPKLIKSFLKENPGQYSFLELETLNVIYPPGTGMGCSVKFIEFLVTHCPNLKLLSIETEGACELNITRANKMLSQLRKLCPHASVLYTFDDQEPNL
uniref:F-box/LRR-repeat protein 15/At3g58940/PEG3-like LRR domain-containing protein n=1 Tax=Chenopodium quinoa TaxID=63459 RepID=A0A803LC49_CHEQI